MVPVTLILGSDVMELEDFMLDWDLVSEDGDLLTCDDVQLLPRGKPALVLSCGGWCRGSLGNGCGWGDSEVLRML